MTLDLAKLKEAAEKALPHPFKGVDTTAERMLAADADAETILALIERLESAEWIVNELINDLHNGTIEDARAHMEKHNG